MSDAVRKTVLTLSAALTAIPAAQAATFTVTNLDDGGPGSLRQAVEDANAAAGADVIDFQAGLTGAIVLSSGQLVVSDSVDIQGPGAGVLAVTGLGDSRLFYLYNGQALLDVTISGLTLSGGSAEIGGAIVDWGENLVLDSVLITGNSAVIGVEGGGDGAGLWATDTGGGMSLTIRDSTISGNIAGSDGGGIYLYETGGPVLLERSTISGNEAADDGGGIYISAIHGDVTLVDSTLSGNTAGDEGGGAFLYSLYDGTVAVRNTTVAANQAVTAGGGIFTVTGPIVFENSIAGDNAAAAQNDLGTAGDGSFDVSWSLVESPGTANLTDNGGNVFNQDPQLGPLADNGGPTLTHRPAATSPVINAGDPAFTPPPSTDQRGLARVLNGRIDMGSVEVAAAGTAGTIQLTFGAANVGEAAGTVTITATRTGGSSGAVSVTLNTVNGTAVSPNDYAAVIGAVLSWADGDTAPKSINVTIVDDADVEPNETFGVVLSNPTGGATLGSPANAMITILDNDGIQAAEVPTVSEIGMAVLTAILSLAGIYLVRRQ